MGACKIELDPISSSITNGRPHGGMTFLHVVPVGGLLELAPPPLTKISMDAHGMTSCVSELSSGPWGWFKSKVTPLMPLRVSYYIICIVGYMFSRAKMPVT